MLCKDKVALVTGAASGIGKAAAIVFAREGACVTVADINRDLGEGVAEDIRAAGGNAIFVQTDVTSEEAIKNVVAKTVAEFGGLDMAFNNAGAPGKYSNAVDCADNDFNRLIDVNMRSVWLCMKYEIPEMLKRGGGGIVNTASRAGDSAVPSMFSYVATKHGVVGITKSAAVDFAAQNIRVNALMPGMTATPMMEDAAKGLNISLADAAAHTIPMKRLADPKEQAEVAVFLCSDRASYLTGVAIAVDGGTSALD